MWRCVCLSESTFKAVQHIFVGNSWIFTMEHIRQILQDIPRRYSSGYARHLFDQLCSKFTMGLGPRARTTNTTPSFSYLAIIWSMSNNKNDPSTNHLHSTNSGTREFGTKQEFWNVFVQFFSWQFMCWQSKQPCLKLV